MFKRPSGFTIVELLIVIVVIGVLALITVVAFNGISNRARASSASSALTQAVKKIAVWQVDNPGVVPATLATAGVSDTSDVSYQYTGSGATYCITATNGSVSYKITESTKPTAGGCAGHGQGGGVAVTNIATNPSNETVETQWSPRWFGNNGGAGTTTHSSAGARCGNLGYRKTWTAQGSGQDIGYTYEQPTFTASRTYAFNVAIRTSFSTVGRAWISWYNSSSQPIGDSNNFVTDYNLSPNVWTDMPFTATAPAGTVRGYFIFSPYPHSGAGMTIPVGSTVDADCVMIVENPTNQNYADGNSANWTWNGTVNNSTSTGPPL